MVLTTRTYTTLFASLQPTAGKEKLVRLPLSIAPQYESRCHITGAIIPTINKPLYRFNLWSSDEHERFLHGLEMFPNGPWKEVAKVVGTKSTRQTMTHAQKYRQKIERRLLAHPKPTPEPKPTKPHKKAPRSAKRASDAALYYPEPLSTVVSSPSSVCSDMFDTQMLDLEFDAILASFALSSPTSEWAIGDMTLNSDSGSLLCI